MTTTSTLLPPPDPGFASCGCAHVAVYGTLRAGGINDIRRLAPDIALLGHTRLHGRLYDLGWYPGLVLDEAAPPVLAEVYALHPALEQALDGIEGLWPTDLGEYAKRILTTAVQPPDEPGSGAARTLPVLVYEARPALVQNAPALGSGDWLAWYAHTGRGAPARFALNTHASAHTNTHTGA
ncbi:MAG: gamma-glutamylcyclotransferase family protein [Pseudomonadota bacterium]|nr:gamma-glutamylcyclotransferase family protein [Pseudomonadota bacterium]